MEGERAHNVIKIGVNITECDVYETAELPEDDQQLVSDYLTELPKNEFIETSRIDANEAFKVFADKNLESSLVDFSDSIATPKVGYPVSKASNVLKKETNEEKYAKLQKAVDDLAQEINIIKENSSDVNSISPPTMLSKLQYLQKELAVLDVRNTGDLDKDFQKVYQRKMLTDLDYFLSTTSSSSAPTSTVSDSTSVQTDVIKYQMYCMPGQSIQADNALITDLEQRIEKCEAAIGLNSEKSGLITGETPSKKLLGALSLVAAKFALLDLSQLSHFESSLLAIQQKQLQASSKSEASDIADKVDKVSRVYEAVRKVNPLMEKLPDVSERIKSLAEIHRSATQFSRTLAYVNSSQTQLKEHLQNHTEHLKQVQAVLGPQMALFEANCKTINNLAE